MSTANLFEYYAARALSPTHAGLVTASDLLAYERVRRTMFRRLFFPLGLFAGRRLLEFGPDTGENSLVFAHWGAQLTLVEPNQKAHPVARAYFDGFQLASQLEGLHNSALLDFQCPVRFDIVDAEGFIYTIRPRRAWIRKCAECLVPGGFLIISYMERYGSFLELLLKAAYRRAIEDPTCPPGIDTAKRLFGPKWNRVSHTRTIDSWLMDVIENPFVRLEYFLDPSELLPEMHQAGLRLYSSWPIYRDPLAVHWIKKPDRADEDLASATSFVGTRRLSHLVGLQAPAISSGASNRLESLVTIADQLCDGHSQSLCEEATEHLSVVLGEVSGDAPAVAVLRMCQTLLHLMRADRVNPMIEFCRTDEIFLSAWGAPAHHAVFEYEPESAV